jgi:uncharacterized protein (DUF2147 family)
MISIHCRTVALVVLALASPAVSADGDAVLGVWVTAPEKDGYAKIELTKEDDRYHGEIVWLSEPRYPADDRRGMGGQVKVDRENPDPALHDRPILGLRILKNFEYVGQAQWKRGTIYDPSNGKTYKCQLKLLDEGTLKVRGYIGVSLLGRTTTWTRADRPSG